MQIILQKVYPDFLEEEKISGSGIWKKDIVINPAEKLLIIAPSGSGKTSLIHFIYGLRKDYSGQLLYNDKNTSTFIAEDYSVYRQQHLSIVFQDLRLFGEQTVWQNLEIKRKLHPFHQQCRIEEMAHALGIKNKLNKRCKTCSYGEQQRIAIIRSLQQPFDFLLLDEPFSHLDPKNRMKAMELIEEETSLRNAAIILADLQENEYYHADKILSL
jgi:putative ABC transport system ATP-binding protein